MARGRVSRLMRSRTWRGRALSQPKATASACASTPSVGQTSSHADVSFQPRLTFPYPSTVPSWYAGHMHRALKSMPSLLRRSPPPLVIEARDARIPLTSINPAFERVLQRTSALQADWEATQGKGKGKGKAKASSDGQNQADDEGGWNKRRLVVYTKCDLVDKKLQEPLRAALRKYGSAYDVLFVDTRNDKDVRKVLSWVHARARHVLSSETFTPDATPSRMNRSRLAGAFRHTPTPEEGVRLVILGMPNVGKSSLLNALRRVGTGKGKAVSTAPEPGHTRKLTGTVRITPDQPVLPSSRGAKSFVLDSDSSAESCSDVAQSASKDRPPPVYVYDTPGVMVPFLGRGVDGAERGVKLAVTAGIKSSLFDAQVLADYLLYRLNLRYLFQQQIRSDSDSSSLPPLQPLYLTHLPLDPKFNQPTNDIVPFLTAVAARAPGTLGKGGVPDLDGAARFFIDRWRDGKVGKIELDLGVGEAASAANLMNGAWNIQDIQQQIDEAVKRHFDSVKQADRELAEPGPEEAIEDPVGVADDSAAVMRFKSRGFKANRFVVGQRPVALPSLVSNHQSRKKNKAELLRERQVKFEERRASTRRPSASGR